MEALERRELLSAAHGFAEPDYVIARPHAAASPFQTAGPTGFSPSQIANAYGFNQIVFPGGMTGNGAGTTIAIVDAYDDPTIANDLHKFDLQFNLPDPSFTKVSQSGSTFFFPTPNKSWAVEISLDVEWAHAMAPGASILLVEANSNSFNDLYTAVSFAATYPGVAVVSMSFGGSEYSSEQSDDSTFTTPLGHTPVTFVASSGDNGAPVSAPAVSPNVLSVGGTSLYLGGGNSYVGESGWSGSGGGVSLYEPQPAYQNGIVAESSFFRTNPDVAYDADPNTGFPVYDSYTNSVFTPWEEVGGTSDAAPQWAALMAIADQGRALAGKGALDGASQTLPMLYQLPSADFHDVISGGSSGSPPYFCGPGYDLVTGRGTPVANKVVSDLVGVVKSNLVLNLVPGFNNVTLQLSPTDPTQLQVLDAGALQSTYALATINNIIVNADAGTDSLTLNYSDGTPLSSAGLHFTGGGGSDTLDVIGLYPGSLWQITGVNAGAVNGNVVFTGVQNLAGGPTDDFQFLFSGSLTGTLDGGGASKLDFSALTANTNVTLTAGGASGGFNGSVPLIGGGFQNVGQIVGSGAYNNTIFGVNSPSTWTITSTNAGTVAGAGYLAFANFKNLEAGTGNDTFHLFGGTLTGTIAGAGGLDRLIGGNQGTTWVLTGANAGNVAGLCFSGIGYLIGGTGNDTFVIAGGTLSGGVDGGGGNNTLIGDNVPDTFVVTGLNSGTATGVGGGFTNLSQLDGGAQPSTFQLAGGRLSGGISGRSGADTLIANNVPNTWTILGPNMGQVTGVAGYFSGIANLIGGTDHDTFQLGAQGSVTGNITGNGADVLVGANVPTTWIINGLNSGGIAGVVRAFSGIANLIGGTANDTFELAGGRLTGSILGGGGFNTLILESAASSLILTGPGAGVVTGVLDGFRGINDLIYGNNTYVLTAGVRPGYKIL